MAVSTAVKRTPCGFTYSPLFSFLDCDFSVLDFNSKFSSSLLLFFSYKRTSWAIFKLIQLKPCGQIPTNIKNYMSSFRVSKNIPEKQVSIIATTPIFTYFTNWLLPSQQAGVTWFNIRSSLSQLSPALKSFFNYFQKDFLADHP